MTVSFTLPIVKQPTSVKDMVFSILMTRHPLSLMELLNTVKKQFNVSVSFQAVRKAVLELQKANVIVREGKKFQISKEWILELIKFGNDLQKNYFSKPESKLKTRLEVGPNVTVYTLPKLVDLDFVWNGIIHESLSNPQAPKIITFKSVHFWFMLVTLAQETELMKEMIRKGVKLYYICYGETPLDKWAVKMYSDIGINCIQMPKPKNFEDGLNIGTYGNYIIQSKYPEPIAKKIDAFFKSCKKIEDARLSTLTGIVTEELDIQLTAQYDLVVAASFRENVIREFVKK